MPLDFQTISLIVFFVVLSLYVFVNRHKLKTHGLFPLFYFSMYKTKFGLKFMEKFSSKFRKSLKFLGYAGIIIGFLGMILLVFSLLQNLFNLVTTPEAQPGVGLVLPFKVKGAFFVPFWYWIISIFIIALVHEFAHGIIARVHNLKVKSSGFAFLGILIPIIPAAFVEPDEKALRKRPHKQQLSVFAAGPFSNIILAFIVLGISAFVFSPVLENMVELSGVEITGFIEGDYPAANSGIAEGEIVKEIGNVPVKSLGNFSALLQSKSPGEIVEIKTDKNNYEIKLAGNPENKSSGYLGVFVQQSIGIKPQIEQKYGKIIPSSILWLVGLFTWLFILNIGIGLFNLVPIGPLDGGRMLQLVLHRLFERKKADKVWYYISMFFLFIVIANISAAFF